MLEEYVREYGYLCCVLLLWVCVLCCCGVGGGGVASGVCCRILCGSCFNEKGEGLVGLGMRRRLSAFAMCLVGGEGVAGGNLLCG